MLIVCNGMIRSGSTIQYNLARELAERAGAGEGLGFIGHDAELGTRELDELAQPGKLKVAKTHRMIPGLEPYCLDGRALLCFTYRHLLDVAGSAKTKFGWPWEQIEAAVAEGIEVHQRVARLPNAIIQRYEDLIDDLQAATRTLHDRMGLQLAQAVIDDIAEANGVDRVASQLTNMQSAARRRENLKRRIRSVGLLGIASRINARLPDALRYKPVIDDKTNLHHNHISAGMGQPGASRRALNDEETRRVIERFGDYLETHGYSPDSVPAAPAVDFENASVVDASIQEQP